MIAAIYARKSTEQKGRAKALSVTQQEEGARAFATARGWAVADTHVYIDDKISGAEFEARPAFQRMMGALHRTAPFQVLIVRDLARLGRESYETNYAIKQLAEAGVEIFEYAHGKSLTPKNAMDKAMGALQGFTDEQHREKSSQQVHEAHTSKHLKGYVVGGRVFGYRNQDVFNGVDTHGRPLRSHVERVIDPDEAAVVERIFTLYDEGYGLKRIATLLTQEGAAQPKPPLRKDGLLPHRGWASSTVRDVLKRETYRGVVIWNKTRKKSSWGKLDPQRRPEGEWLRTEVKELRIITKELWERVAARRTDAEGRTMRFASGRMSGRPPKHAAQNLLAGLATCGICGGGLIIDHSNTRKGRFSFYICHRRRNNGSCANTLRVPLDTMNEAVLQAIEEHALTPEAIDQVISLTERDDVAEQQTALAREAADISTRIARLVAAIETGGEAMSLVAKVRALETRRIAIAEDLRGLRPLPRLAPALIENRLAEWRRLLRASVTQGRTVLQRLLRGRIIFTPHRNVVSGEIDGYEFEAMTRFDRLFTGIATPRPASLDPGDRAGTEDIGPEEMGEGDYGRLLEAAAMRKGWCARQDSNLWPTAPEAVALSS